MIAKDNAIMALNALLAPVTGCGPVGAKVRVTREGANLRVCADIETALDSLPAVGGSWRPPLFDLAVRGRGTNGPEAHIAYPAQNDWKRRPHVRLWGAPDSDPDLSTYSSRHERLDDTHTRFEATVPLALLGLDVGDVGVRALMVGYRGGCPLVRLQSAGPGPWLDGWDGEFARVAEAGVDIALGAVGDMIAPLASVHLMSDAELGIAALPDERHAPVREDAERAMLDGAWRFSGEPALPNEPAGAWRQWPPIRVPGHHALQNLPIATPDGHARWRRAFDLPRAYAGRRLLLRLESVEGLAEVRLNGQRIETLDNPYLPNELDVTAAARPGAENLLELRISSDGDLTAATGRERTALVPDITGRVWLDALPAAWIENLVCDTDHTGGLRLAWRVAGAAENCRTVARVCDQAGTELWRDERAAGTARVAGRVAGARTWCPEEPHLYQLDMEVWRAGERLARYARRIGFRSMRAGDGKLWLNGKPIVINGTCHHPQQPHTGWCLTPEEHRADARLYREANVNCVRVWPLDEAFLDACDELGLMVQMEVPISFYAYSGDPFNPKANRARKNNPAVRDANVRRTLQFLLHYRNHACVCLWSVGNESDWDEGFEASARAIKRLDPDRPVLASQNMSRGLGLSCLDVDTFHYPLHYCGKPVQATGDRPILYTEWCHISCRNVAELTADPSLHDRHVDALKRCAAIVRDNDVGCAGGHIFTGVEAIAYAYPPGYPVTEDHVPVRGFVDRWRRPTPEYHHVWKCYAPVDLDEASFEPAGDTWRVRGVTARHAQTALNAYRFVWRSGARSGEARLAGADELRLPAAGLADTVELSCYGQAGRCVNRWTLWTRPEPGAPARETPAARFASREADGGLWIEHGALTWRFDRAGLPWAARTADGARLAWDVGRLVVTRGACDAADGLCEGWDCEDVRLEATEGHGAALAVVLRGRYANCAGTYRFRFGADGRVRIAYDFAWAGDELRARELGIALRLPRDRERLTWRRDADWSWYPADHIGRAEGVTPPFPTPHAVHAGPWDRPTWPWAHDATPAGCADFRSTKRRVRVYALRAADGTGVEFEAAGDRHARARVEADCIVVQCCHYSGRSAEPFVKGLDLDERHLVKGARITGETVLRFE